jgi:hypothetical protein
VPKSMRLALGISRVCGQWRGPGKLRPRASRCGGNEGGFDAGPGGVCASRAPAAAEPSARARVRPASPRTARGPSLGDARLPDAPARLGAPRAVPRGKKNADALLRTAPRRACAASAPHAHGEPCRLPFSSDRAQTERGEAGVCHCARENAIEWDGVGGEG